MARHEWAPPNRNDAHHRTLHAPQLWAHRSGSHNRRPKGVYKAVDRQTRWLGSYGGRGADRSDLRKRKRLFAPDWQIARTATDIPALRLIRAPRTASPIPRWFLTISTSHEPFGIEIT